MTVEYEGGGFEGWQLQPAGRTVQGVLEEGIGKVTGDRARVHGAGRTDAGVHAMGQVCHFDSNTGIAVEELERALNAVLPEDLGVVAVEEAPPGFDARRDAVSKTYLYRVLNRSAPSPLRQGVTWHRRRLLDLEQMRAAAAPLVGKHDFATFRGAPRGPPPEETTVRSLDRLEVTREGDEIHFRAVGRSFMRYMVRNLVGTLVEVGRGRWPAGEMLALLESGDRSRAGPTAPARGLCLVRIDYAGFG